MAAARSSTPRSGSGGPGPRLNRITRIVLLAWIIVPVAMGARMLIERQAVSPARSVATEPKSIAMERVGPPSGIRTQSCSASACHGSLSPDPNPSEIRRDEYFVWLTDPHAQAYRALLGPKSQEMLQRLGVADSQRQPLPGRESEFQQQWTNCLACHETNTHLSPSTAAMPDHEFAGEGVSCESCHGDARDWLHLHYRRPVWAAIGEAEKSKLKNVPGSPVSDRIKQCATCHVGGAQGDVTHDLIAAGHPALKFEYVWYQSRLPRHWKSGRVPTERSDPTKRWIIGQVVAAIASLEQLERRAAQQGSDLASWPELAEHNCFACHHGLSAASWRQAVGLSGLEAFAKNGEPLPVPWGNWNLDVIQILADQFGSQSAQAAAAAFGRLHQDFKDRKSPDRGWVLEQSASARNLLQAWLAELAVASERDVTRLLQQVVRNRTDQIISSWDKTATIVLGFAAGFRESDQIPDVIRTAMDLVRFPGDADSPRDFPFAGSPKSAQVKVDSLNDLLKQLADVFPPP